MTAISKARRRAQWLFGAAIGILLSVLAVLWYGGERHITRQYRRALEEATARASAGTDMVEQSLLRSFEGVALLHHLAQSAEAASTAGNLALADGIRAELRQLAMRGDFGSLQVATIDAQGILTWSSVPGWMQVDLSDREHFRVHLDGRRTTFVSAPLVGRASRRWSIQVTRPLREADGGFAGVVVVSVNPGDLASLLREVVVNREHQAMLVRTEGEVVADTTPGSNNLGSRLPDGHPLIAGPRHGGPRQALLVSEAAAQHDVLFWKVLPEINLTIGYSVSLLPALQEAGREAALLRAALSALSLALLAATVLAFLWDDRRRTRSALQQTERERGFAEAAWHEAARVLAGVPGYPYVVVAAAAGHRLHQAPGGAPTGERGFVPLAPRDSAEFMAMVEPEARAAVAGLWHQAAAEGQASLEYRIRDASGTQWLWLREAVRVIGQQPGGVEMVGHLSDITRERDMAAQAITSSKLALLGEMATSMAHELNQPIIVMSMAAENLEGDLHALATPVPAEAWKRLALIADQAERARAIIDHLQIFGRADSATVGPTDLLAVLRGALVLARPILAAANCRIDTQLPARMPLVRASQIPLEQAIVNLMLNARDAMQDLPDERRVVTLAAIGVGDEVCVTVADRGPGFSPQALAQAFEAFFTTKPPGQGTGLGLFICRRTVAGFGGWVRASNGDTGAEVRIGLRLAEGDAIGAVAQPIGACGRAA